MNINKLLDDAESALILVAQKDKVTRNTVSNALFALTDLRTILADYQALSDTVAELERIEQEYSRREDNSWPEWDNAYDAMYKANQKVRGKTE